MSALYSTQCIFPLALPEQCTSLGGGKPTPTAVPQTAGVERKKAGALHGGSASCDAKLGMEQWIEDAGVHRARDRIAPGHWGSVGGQVRQFAAVPICGPGVLPLVLWSYRDMVREVFLPHISHPVLSFPILLSE